MPHSIPQTLTSDTVNAEVANNELLMSSPVTDLTDLTLAHDV